MMSSHVKITCGTDHCCYVYVINRGFCYESEMVWYCIDVYVINRTLHCCLEIRDFSSLVKKIYIYFTRTLGLLLSCSLGSSRNLPLPRTFAETQGYF